MQLWAARQGRCGCMQVPAAPPNGAPIPPYVPFCALPASPLAAAHSCSAVAPGWLLISSSTVLFSLSAPGGDAMAKKPGLPSSLVLAWMNWPACADKPRGCGRALAAAWNQQSHASPAPCSLCAPGLSGAHPQQAPEIHPLPLAPPPKLAFV